MRKEISPLTERARFNLAEIVTKDKLFHQGVVAFPKVPGKRAVLWIHGLVSRFYSDTELMNRFADECTNRGMAFAAFNNRGHDYVTSTHKTDSKNPKGYVHTLIGAGVEDFAESTLDVDAAISYFADHGYSEVVLVGHSSGANKACFYSGTIPDIRVAGVVLAGPMSDRYSASDEETNAKHQAFMEQKIREGKGDELLTGFDFFPLTPKRWMSLLAKGSPEDVFNYHDEKGALRTFSAITVPMLVMFGGSDEHADRPVPEMKKAFDLHAASSKYMSVIIPGADHGFTGKEQEFVDTIVSWAALL